MVGKRSQRRKPDREGRVASGQLQATEAGDGYRELGDDLLQRSDKLRHGCVGCPVQCEHRFERPRVERNGRPVRLEYQTVYALGPLCNIDDLNVITEAAGLCDDYGMDTVSAGATIAWAMESVQRGVLKLDAKTDPNLEFGDGAALLECIELIARRQGVGALLAEGSLKAAQRVGGGAEEWSMQIKGLEMPGIRPAPSPESGAWPGGIRERRLPQPRGTWDGYGTRPLGAARA